jgi:hypothetical protein
MSAIECFQRRKEFKTKAKGSNHESRLIKIRTFSCNGGPLRKIATSHFKMKSKAKVGEMAHACESFSNQSADDILQSSRSRAKSIITTPK